MNISIFEVYEALTGILPFLITLLLFINIYKSKDILQPKYYYLLVIIFCFYIIGVFYFTGISTIYDWQRYGIKTYNGQINLTPFSQPIDITGYVLNILLFVPFGFLIPLIWPNTNKCYKIIAYGCLFSLLIEFSQLFNHRATDIDDVILNTLGALVGYLLFKVFSKVTKLTFKSLNPYHIEPLVFITVIFLGRFLLFNEMGLASIIYGF